MYTVFFFNRKNTWQQEPSAGGNFSCENWSVLTTVVQPSLALARQAQLGPSWCILIVLDRKSSPSDHAAESMSAEEKKRVVYLDATAQSRLRRKLKSAMSEKLHWPRLGRKNVGYLYAIASGARRVLDLDKDRTLLGETFQMSAQDKEPVPFAVYERELQRNFLTFNLCPMVNASTQWGSPLYRHHLHASDISDFTIPSESVAFIQSLANYSQNIDLTHCLSQSLNGKSERQSVTVAIPKTLHAPLHARATYFLEPALWLLFLPTSILGRVSRVWRGCIAQRLAKIANKTTLISSPSVRYTNTYMMRDLRDDQDLYSRSEALLNALESISFQAKTIPGILEETYLELYAKGFLKVEDVLMAQNWISALLSLGYVFPNIVPTTPQHVQEHVHVQTIANVRVSIPPKTSECLDWPELELFLPISPSHHREFQQQLLPSLLLFWPLKYLKMVVLLDGEIKKHNFENALRKETEQFISLRMKYNEPTDYYGDLGHDRQQLIMFWADNFTKSEYVGFVDTDALFVTPVYKGDLFIGGKPVIIGLQSVSFNGWWGRVSRTTAQMLGNDELFRCMSYFPVIIKTEHLRFLRQFVRDKHGIGFNEFFRDFLAGKPYSQFNIMCNYLWHHHRDEYSWHVQLYGKPGVIRDAMRLSRNHFTDEQLRPIPRVAIHTNYHYVRSEGLPNKLMAMGYCYDTLARKRGQSEWCSKNNVTLPEVNLHMFNFEGNDWGYHPKVKEAFKERQKRVRRCPPHSWDSKLLDRLSSKLS